MFRSVRPYLEQAGIDDPVVCYQGAVVADPRTGEFLRHEPIPLELARETIAVLQEEGFHVNCYVNDELYVAEVTPEAERYAGFQNLPLHAVGDLAAWLSEPPTKLVTIDDPDVLDGLEARMKERFAGRLYISKSLPFFLEFASPEVTKASGSPSSPSTSASRRAHRRLRGRGERRRAPRVGGLRRRGRQRAPAGPRGRRLGLPFGRGRGRWPR